MKKLLVTINLILIFINTNAQIIPVPLYDRIMRSPFIFEGEVISSHSYWAANYDFIYTSNTVKIMKIFKGELECGTVEIITNGGSVGETTMDITHNLILSQGQIGVFMCMETDRELSTVDFYPESNFEKFQVKFEEQGYIKYLDDELNEQVIDMWGSLDSLAQLYDLVELAAQINYVDCFPGESIFPKPIPYEIKNNAKRKIQNTKGFKVNSNETMEKINAALAAATVVNSNSRSVDEITYEFDHLFINDDSVNRYLEFDITIKANNDTTFLSYASINIKYDTLLFGSNIATGSTIQITPWPMVADVLTYFPPFLVNYGSPDEIRFGTGVIPGFQSQSALHSTPQKLYHVKIELDSCSTNWNDFIFTNDLLMLSTTKWATSPTDPNIHSYNTIDVTDVQPIPDCVPTIIEISPTTVSGGIGDTVSIFGFYLGHTQGDGKIFLKNADNGGIDNLRLDSTDYNYWSDTLIKFVVPSYVRYQYDSVSSTYSRATPGSGALKVFLNSGDSLSTTPFTIFYSVSNDRNSYSAEKKQAFLQDRNGTGGYTFRLDSMMYNYGPNFYTMNKAMRDWVCLTEVNFNMGTDTIPWNKPTYSADEVNMIQFGDLDSTTLAQTAQWIHQCVGEEQPFVYDIDLIMNRNIAWQYDTTGVDTIEAGNEDFYAVALHELGHAVGLKHVLDNQNIMYWQQPQTPTLPAQRPIGLFTDNACYYGGNHIVGTSANYSYTITCYGVNEAMIPYTQNQLSCNLPSGIIPIKSFDKNVSIIFYPNPFSDFGTLNFELAKNAIVSLSVTDNLGRQIILFENMNEVQGFHSYNVNGEKLSAGIYFVTLKVNGMNHIFKIIKQ